MPTYFQLTAGQKTLLTVTLRIIVIIFMLYNLINIGLSVWHKVYDLTPAERTAVRETALNKRLMDTNGCQLPCWWGISPGDTAVDAVQALKQIDPQWTGFPGHGRGAANNRSTPLTHAFTKDGETDSIGMELVLVEQADQVSLIEFHALRLNLAPNLLPQPSQQHLANLFVPTIVQTWGTPDMIYLQQPGNWVEVTFYYPSQQTILSYQTQLRYNEAQQATACLSMGHSEQLSLYTYDPALDFSYQGTSYAEIIWPLVPTSLSQEEQAKIDSWQVENLLGLSEEQFVSLLLADNNGDGCFSWPAE